MGSYGDFRPHAAFERTRARSEPRVDVQTSRVGEASRAENEKHEARTYMEYEDVRARRENRYAYRPRTAVTQEGSRTQYDLCSGRRTDVCPQLCHIMFRYMLPSTRGVAFLPQEYASMNSAKLIVTLRRVYLAHVCQSDTQNKRKARRKVPDYGDICFMGMYGRTCCRDASAGCDGTWPARIFISSMKM